MTTITHSVQNGTTSAASCLVVPDGSPTYAELLAERDRLLKENARLVEELSKEAARADNNWEVLESVACGETIE
jgi:malate/lactate dehydrogenase